MFISFETKYIKMSLQTRIMFLTVKKSHLFLNPHTYVYMIPL